ncbi:MAG: fumarylacetoacetate hydrolase family protein, partial [Terriglobia bacterium]
MKLRRVASAGAVRLELLATQGWVPVDEALARAPSLPQGIAGDAIVLLAMPFELRQRLCDAARDLEPTGENAPSVLPFEPRSFRDFMLYEAHAIAAARGFVNAYMPAAARVVSAYEALTRRTFPKLKPHALWYRQPLYYMGNHLT